MADREKCCTTLFLVLLALVACIFLGLTFHYHAVNNELHDRLGRLESKRTERLNVTEKFPTFFMNKSEQLWLVHEQNKNVRHSVTAQSNVSYPCDVMYSGMCHVRLGVETIDEIVPGVYIGKNGRHPAGKHVGRKALHHDGCCELFQYWHAPKNLTSVTLKKHRKIAQLADYKQLVHSQVCRNAKDCVANCYCVQDFNLQQLVTVKVGFHGNKDDSGEFEADWFKIPHNCHCQHN